MSAWKLGIIGGSGLYDLERIESPRWERVSTPWGAPSDDLLTGQLFGIEVVFLPRHGRGHRLSPHEVNARANIDALKRLGCTDVLAISAVGSLREDFAPGRFVIVNQYVDRTRMRPSTFFGNGVVAHVSLADPVCPRLSGAILQAGKYLDFDIFDGGTYLAIDGPQFSTRAESHIYRQLGCDLIGMTAMPEVRLAREAELPYANLCMVTDYDCWRSQTDAVDVPEVLRIMRNNADRAKSLLAEFVKRLPGTRVSSPIDTCLDVAIVSDPSAMNDEAKTKLSAITSRRFGHVAA